MEAQLIKEGQIDTDTINKKDLLNICFQMLKESKELGEMTDEQQSEFIKKYHTFSAEYPSVFNSIMIEKYFYVKPFLEYLDFKKKQPLVYTNTEQCVKDLCYYPIRVFKHINNHYNERDYKDFKTQLYAHMTEYHNKQKEQLKQMTQQVLEQQNSIKQHLINNILSLATQYQLQK